MQIQMMFAFIVIHGYAYSDSDMLRRLINCRIIIIIIIIITAKPSGRTLVVVVCTPEMVRWSSPSRADDGLCTTCFQTCHKVGNHFARCVHLCDANSPVYFLIPEEYIYCTSVWLELKEV